MKKENSSMYPEFQSVCVCDRVGCGGGGWGEKREREKEVYTETPFLTLKVILTSEVL